MSVYQYEVMDMNGEVRKMSEYKGKVLLIVNTATECGFTSQYDDLQDLYEKYQVEGLEILDFPCNQFGNQAPGTEQEIASFCDSRYGITFSQFSKIKVNGKNAAPLYQFLKSQKGFAGFSEEHPLTPLMESVAERNDPDYKNNAEIKWNFTKFLIDRNGNVVERFEPTEDMVNVAHKVKELLDQNRTESKKIEYNYQTKNTCSQSIQFDLDGNVVTNIRFIGGCNGNLKAISALVDGWTVEQIEEKCKGITCGRHPTSCSDQLACAVREAYNKTLA